MTLERRFPHRLSEEAFDRRSTTEQLRIDLTHLRRRKENHSKVVALFVCGRSMSDCGLGSVLVNTGVKFQINRNIKRRTKKGRQAVVLSDLVECAPDVLPAERSRVVQEGVQECQVIVLSGESVDSFIGDRT